MLQQLFKQNETRYTDGMRRNADYELNRNRVLTTKTKLHLVQALDDLQAIRKKGGSNVVVTYKKNKKKNNNKKCPVDTDQDF